MYNEIIELDIFDDLIEDKNINIVICTQLIFCDYLNNQHDLNSNYKFEVTHDINYKNGHLARYGIPDDFYTE